MKFDRATICFSQDGNTLGTTAEHESLEISFLTQFPGEEPFVVIKSETGWSLDDEELEQLKQLIKILKKNFSDITCKQPR